MQLANQAIGLDRRRTALFVTENCLNALGAPPRDTPRNAQTTFLIKVSSEALDERSSD